MVLRLSARPDDRSGTPPHAPQNEADKRLFKRFFDLLERLLPEDAAPETKTRKRARTPAKRKVGQP
jgi:hypothetical protein